MKIDNKNLYALIAVSLFFFPTFSYADMTMNSTGVTTTDSTGVITSQTSNLLLEGKKTNLQNNNQVLKENIMSGLSEEQKTQLEYMKKNLEKQIIALKESITKENIEEIKIKAEELKKTFLTQAEELNLPEVKKMIEDRFYVFYQNNFVNNKSFQEIKSIAKDQYKEGKENIKKNINEKRPILEENLKNLKKDFLDERKKMLESYKKTFKVKLDTILKDMSDEKIEKILIKVEEKIKKIEKSNLTEEKKSKILAQLDSIKEILQENLSENISDEVNLDELINE